MNAMPSLALCGCPGERCLQLRKVMIRRRAINLSKAA